MGLFRVKCAVDELDLTHIVTLKETELTKHAVKRQKPHARRRTGKTVRAGKRTAARRFIVKNALLDRIHFLIAVRKRDCGQIGNGDVTADVNRAVSTAPRKSRNILIYAKIPLCEFPAYLFPLAAHNEINHRKRRHKLLRVIRNLRTAANDCEIRHRLREQAQQLFDRLDIPNITRNPEYLRPFIRDRAEHVQQRLIDTELRNPRSRHTLAQIPHRERRMRILGIDGQP